MSSLIKIAPGTYELAKKEGMLVPGLVITNEELLKEASLEEALEQVRNVAHLPGIVGHSIAMPDMHWGYGFPIGGVASFDAEKGVISPGGVGYDINCGVRLAVVPIAYKSLKPKIKKHLLNSLFKHVPSGIGKGHHKNHLSEEDYRQIIKKGAKWSIEQGFGFPKDLEHSESHGLIEGADFNAVSEEAKLRGKSQLGSIGSGNHFVEIGEVETIYHPEIAAMWNIEAGQTYILIHSGSRGFGHQICQDTLNRFIRRGYDKGLPDRQLVCAPLHSSEGQQYFSAMAAAANFAFNNRQQILHSVRMAFKEILETKPEDIRQIYDVCHNIAKWETHFINGKMQKVCVHRKGATRAFGKGAEELIPLFKATGQPVLVPGDMGRASHLMVGLGNPLTFSSACHGAGRARSRHQSQKVWSKLNPFKYLESIGVEVMASSGKTVIEEMPDAYKNVDDVVDAVSEARLADKVARLKPSLVIKG